MSRIMPIEIMTEYGLFRKEFVTKRQKMISDHDEKHSP